MSGNAEPVIHIVDDAAAVRDSLQILLESHGMAMRTYGSANEFLTSTDLREPACLILDLHLPVLGGLDLMRSLRERSISLSVVSITGRNDRKMKARAFDAGAIAFLEKPVVEQTLLAAIQDAFAAARREGRPCVRKTGLKTTAGRPGS